MPVKGRRRALITGIGGQDGSLLAELLLAEGYEVFGVVRRPTSERTRTSTAIRERIELVQADLLDQRSLVDALRECPPHEVYNLASPSFVPMSWNQPVLTAEFAAVGVTSMLEAIRRVDPEIRFYQASSSEIFGEPRERAAERGDAARRRSRRTASRRRTATSSRAATGSRYGLYACSGILYNHESPRRPLDFLPRKVAHGGGGDLARAVRRALARRPRRAARLGLRRRLRPRDVADAPAGRAGRLRDRDGRAATRSRSSSSSPSAASASTGRSTCTSTSRCAAAAPSSTTSSATRRRRASGSAGSRRSTSRGSSRLLVDADLERLRASARRRELSSVDLVVLAGAALPGEAGAPARSPPAGGESSTRRIAVGDRLEVERVEVDGGVAADLGERGDVRARDRAPAGHRLDAGDAEALVQAREDERRRGAVEADELVEARRGRGTRRRPGARGARARPRSATSRSPGRSARTCSNASKSRAWFLCGQAFAG